MRGAVDRQLAVGIDVGNDGEQPRAGFSTYVARRMRGFGGESRRRLARDLIEHPDYAALLASRRQGAARIGNAPQAVAEIEYADLREAEAECRLFLAATAAHPRRFAERFMTAVSPGTAATILLERALRLPRAVRPGPRPRAAEGVRAGPRPRPRPPAGLPGPRHGAVALLPGRAARALPGDGGAPRGRHQPGHRGHPARPRAAPRVLGQLRRAAHPRRAAARPCCPSCTAPTWARSRCRWPGRATSTSTGSSSAIPCPPGCCSCPA